MAYFATRTFFDETFGEAILATHSAVILKPSCHDGFYNEDLVRPRQQAWTRCNIFAFWMSDEHSVGWYIAAGNLFLPELVSWQILIGLIVGIFIVQAFCNLLTKPSHVTRTSYSVVYRVPFGVKGANTPAIIHGSIAVAWYGIQIFLAVGALQILALKSLPDSAPYTCIATVGFVGLSSVGWACFMLPVDGSSATMPRASLPDISASAST